MYAKLRGEEGGGMWETERREDGGEVKQRDWKQNVAKTKMREMERFENGSGRNRSSTETERCGNGAVRKPSRAGAEH